jgi:glycerol-3-phosphate dehydrogenase
MTIRRQAMLDRLRAAEVWDLAVIGGGATGLGTAVDAAARGYRTVLLEAHDFAKGTSSRSTKLIHGGVRYLEQGNLALVREALHERALLRHNAPHLVRERAFVVPAYHWWAVPFYGLGLKLYDMLAGQRGLGRSRWIARREAIARVPTLESKHLRGAILYYDGQFDDARLAIALLRTLLFLDGVALNYAPVNGFLRAAGRVAGVTATDAETGEPLTLRARAVVNATGVFADAVRRLDDPSAAPMLRPSQGAHLVLDRSFLPGDSAVLGPHTADGRVMFAIPWHGRTLIGTTETPIRALALEPRPLPEEIAFLLHHAARYLTRDPAPRDVLSAFAGLRPLVGPIQTRATSEISREHIVTVSSSGLVTVTGGKWTTYRRMGADAVARAAAVAGLPARACATEHLVLHGGSSGPVDGPLGVYGSDIPALERLLAERPEWSEPLHPALPYRAGEVVWAARFEMARTVEDVLARRTRALVLDARASQAAAPRVAALLAAELGRDAHWQAEQVRQYQELASGYVLP